MSSTTTAPLEPVSGRSRRDRALAAGGLAAVLLASHFYEPWSQAGPALCPLRAATGLNCPGCGLTRSFCAMAHGRVGDAAAFHWLGPALFVAAAIAVPVLIYEIVRRQKIRIVHRLLFSRRLAYAAAALLVLNWACHVVAQTRSGELLASMKTSWIGSAVRCAGGMM